MDDRHPQSSRPSGVADCASRAAGASMAVADRPPASGRTAQRPDNPHLPTAYRLLPTVYLVGAGPGDPDLITVKGLRCLRRADVVIYDRLIDPALLDEARPDAARIFVGKGAGYHTMPQEQINALLVAHARQGRVVVRAIIDTAGRVEPTSLKIVQSPSPGFDEPTKQWALKALFRPARLHGRAVRSYVNLPFDYSLGS